jgi:hypothetical protein
MKLWQRALLIVIAVAALYALWRFPLGGLGTVVLGACAAWLGRGIYRSKLAANPLGEDRDYSLRPGLFALAKAGGLFAVAMLWTMLAAYGVRLRYIPDTKLSVVIFIGPALLLLAIAAVYLFAGMARILFGSKPPQGGLQ